MKDLQMTNQYFTTTPVCPHQVFTGLSVWILHNQMLHEHQPVSLCEMTVSICLSPPPYFCLAGGLNSWRYGLSWSGSTHSYCSRFGWAQLWLAQHWRLVQILNHFVLTSAFVTQCCRWLSERRVRGELCVNADKWTPQRDILWQKTGIIMHVPIHSLKVQLCFT